MGTPETTQSPLAHFDAFAQGTNKTCDELRADFAQHLAALAGTTFETYESKQEIAREVNKLRKKLGLALRSADHPEKGRTLLRTYTSKRMRNGTFQLVATKNGRSVYSGVRFPPLEAYDPEAQE
jgi:hypothetical protein